MVSNHHHHHTIISHKNITGSRVHCNVVLERAQLQRRKRIVLESTRHLMRPNSYIFGVWRNKKSSNYTLETPQSTLAHTCCGPPPNLLVLLLYIILIGRYVHISGAPSDVTPKKEPHADRRRSRRRLKRYEKSRTSWPISCFKASHSITHTNTAFLQFTIMQCCRFLYFVLTDLFR